MSKNLQALSDEEVVILVRNANQELYREIVVRYQEKLIRYVAYLIGDENLAADAVQQTFIKAFVNLHGFKVKKKFSSWIYYRIAHNEAMNLTKANERVKRVKHFQRLYQPRGTFKKGRGF